MLTIENGFIINTCLKEVKMSIFLNIVTFLEKSTIKQVELLEQHPGEGTDGGDQVLSLTSLNVNMLYLGSKRLTTQI